MKSLDKKKTNIEIVDTDIFSIGTDGGNKPIKPINLDKKKTKELECGNPVCPKCGYALETKDYKYVLTQQRTELLEEILEENFCDLDGTYDYDGIAQSVIDLHKKL